MQAIELKEQSGLFGDVHIVERNTITGEIVGEFEEKNIVLNQGKGFILRAFAEAANSVTDTAMTIKIGKDTGTGTLMNPSDPVATMSETFQEVVYSVPSQEFFVSYPTENSVRFLATINGANVMAGYPSLPNVIYTSASIYTNSGRSVTYKRFPARTISSLISVDISWTLTIV